MGEKCGVLPGHVGSSMLSALFGELLCRIYFALSARGRWPEGRITSSRPSVLCVLFCGLRGQTLLGSPLEATSSSSTLCKQQARRPNRLSRLPWDIRRALLELPASANGEDRMYDRASVRSNRV